MKGQKRNNAVGKKGRSGRKSALSEETRKMVIEKSWDILLAYLNKADKNEMITIEKRKIALEIAKKTIPQNFDLTTKGEKLNNYSDEQLKLIAQRILNDSGTKS
ncbi:MAG: hypothetical protein V1779_17740 [bacterium]